jgi:hypothetical protein
MGLVLISMEAREFQITHCSLNASFGVSGVAGDKTLSGRNEVRKVPNVEANVGGVSS